MPYASVEKQREYQRKWAASRSVPFQRPKTLTWEDLQELKNTDKLSTYKDCVKEAKEALGKGSNKRLKLAMICLRACKIRWGGNQKKDVLPNNIVAFAKEVGIHPKTLGDWVVAVRRVYLHLNDEEKQTFNMHTARIAMARDGRDVPTEEIVESYRLMSSDRSYSMAYYAIRYLSGAEKALARPGALGKLKKAQRERALECTKRILDILR